MKIDWVKVVILVSVVTSAQAKDSPGLTPQELTPAVSLGKGGGTLLNPPSSGKDAAATNGINYHGGPLMLGTPNIYFIWYGNWDGNSAVSILTDWANNIGGSDYYNINRSYYDGSNNHLSNAAAFGGAAFDNYSRGTHLTDDAIAGIVSDALSSGSLPVDSNGLYFVLTSADVSETSGFCSFYCGWHTSGTISGTDIKYSFVGDPDRCPHACEAQTVSSPNDNPGADGMVSVLSHEFEETTSDPDLNAWYQDGTWMENADKCAWTFGDKYVVSNGSKANVHIGSRDYLIQRNWVNDGGGYCALSYQCQGQDLCNQRCGGAYQDNCGDTIVCDDTCPDESQSCDDQGYCVATQEVR